MSKICKDDFIRELAAESDITLTNASDILGDVLYLLSEHMKKGDTVMLTGFGTFSIQDQRPRKGRNMRTGEPIEIPAKKKIKFQASGSLSESVQHKIDLRKKSKIDLTKH